jgi:hypothetical protein
MANRDLLKEAIADAKTVKETAIANAKAALEEAFNPMIREKLAAKIAEMDEMDEVKSKVEENEKEEVEENFNLDEYAEEQPSRDDDGDGKADLDEYAEEQPSRDDDGDGKADLDEMDLDELLRELDELDVEEGLGTINDPAAEPGTDDHGNISEAEEAESEEEDEEIDLENMSEDDLKSFIETVIADMVSAGELEAGEGMEGEEGEEGMEDEEGMEGEEGEEGEMEMMAEMKKMKKEVEEAKKAKEKAEKELKEALSTVSTIRTELQEVNLFNAKLLYTNKIFKAKNLSESQKVKVLAAFDKAASVKEAKLVFETLSEGFVEKKAPMNESLIRGGASKATGVATKKPILESYDQVARWQKLAGIK